MNKKKMEREKRRITIDNDQIAKRISNQKPTCSRRKQLEHSDKLVNLIHQMERIPRQQRNAMKQTVNPANHGLVYQRDKTISESMKEMRCRTAKYKEDQNKPSDPEKQVRVTTSKKLFRLTSRENIFEDKRSTLNNFFIQKNPNSYTIEFTVNQITTCTGDYDKFRYMISHQSFSTPIVFNPKSLNQTCNRVVDTTEKEEGEVFINIQVFAVIDSKEEFIFDFDVNFTMGTVKRKIERTVESSEGENCITLFQKLY